MKIIKTIVAVLRISREPDEKALQNVDLEFQHVIFPNGLGL